MLKPLGKNLRRFDLLTQMVGSAILAAVGYAMLYAPNTTLGAKPTNHLVLPAWGLGAQTTFADIASLLQDWHSVC